MSVLDQLLNLRHHISSLIHFIERGIQFDQRAVAVVGPQFLAQAFRIVRDHRIGGSQDVAGRAVILFQPNGARAGIIVKELLHVADLRAAPAVNRLVVIADHEHLAAFAGKQTDEGVLHIVGVLEFVDQNLAETLPVVFQQRRRFQQGFVRAQQNLGEIHQAGTLAADLVLLIHLQLRPGVGIAHRNLNGGRSPAGILLGIDPPHQLLRRKAGVVQLQIGDHALDHAQLIVGIEHLKAFRQRGILPVQAQQPVRDAVEGPDPHATCTVRQQCGDARAHFGSGFIGEGDRQNAVQRNIEDLIEPTYAVGQHAGLSGTGAGQHQIRARLGTDGLALRRIQGIDEAGDIHYLPLTRLTPGSRST